MKATLLAALFIPASLVVGSRMQAGSPGESLTAQEVSLFREQALEQGKRLVVSTELEIRREGLTDQQWGDLVDLCLEAATQDATDNQDVFIDRTKEFTLALLDFSRNSNGNGVMSIMIDDQVPEEVPAQPSVETQA